MATTEIQQAAIYRCTDKATREVFYVVKSDRQDAWYTLRFDAATAEWTCDCPATKPCKHIRAVNEILKIRRARLAEQIGGDMPTIAAEIQAYEDRRVEAQPVVLRDGEGMVYVMRGDMYCCMSAHDLALGTTAYREGDERDQERLKAMLAGPANIPVRQCEIWDDRAVERTAAERRAAFEAVAAQVRAIEARAKTVSCKRAKQFAHLPLNGNADFGLLKPAQ